MLMKDSYSKHQEKKCMNRDLSCCCLVKGLERLTEERKGGTFELTLGTFLIAM